METPIAHCAILRTLRNIPTWVSVLQRRTLELGEFRFKLTKLLFS